MTDLEALKAELERQDREFEDVCQKLRALDPETEFRVSLEAFEELRADPTPKLAGPTPSWSTRA